LLYLGDPGSKRGDLLGEFVGGIVDCNVVFSEELLDLHGDGPVELFHNVVGDYFEISAQRGVFGGLIGASIWGAVLANSLASPPIAWVSVICWVGWKSMALSFVSSSPSSLFTSPEWDPYSFAALSSLRARWAVERDREVAIREGGLEGLLGRVQCRNLGSDWCWGGRKSRGILDQGCWRT